MGFSGADSGEVMSRVNKPGIVVCIDWATDMVVAKETNPIVDGIASKGIEDATYRRIKLPDISIGKMACRVAGCSVMCRIVTYIDPETDALAVSIDSGDGEADFEQCPKRSMHDTA